MDWQTLRDDYIRKFINDTSASPRWSDTELEVYINLAVNDFSTHIPVVKSSTYVPSSSTDKTFTLPSDTLEVLYVEHPQGTFLEPSSNHPAERYGTGGKRYDLSSDEVGAQTLTLLGTPRVGDDLIIRYGAYRSAITATSDAVPVPRAATLAMLYYVAMLCHERVATQDSNLSRWGSKEDKGRTRQDNPLIPEAERLRQMYLREINKLKDASRNIYRRGGRS